MTAVGEHPGLRRRAQLGERFQLLSELGRGAMGVVYEAWDAERQLHVALKTLRDVQPDAAVGLKEEFRARADVAHPNVVSLYDLVAMDGSVLLTMELVDGMPLIDWIRGEGWAARRLRSQTTMRPLEVASGPLATFEEDTVDTADTMLAPRAAAHVLAPDLERLSGAFRQVVSAVSALHRARLLHRDLKPANVLVTAEGRVVLVDFGLVLRLGDGGVAAGDGFIAGTAAYMAPEQVQGRDLTPAADWYAVGVMLFEALTGVRPFDGGTSEILARKLMHDAPAPSDLCQGVPEHLDRLTVGLMARDVADRPSPSEVESAFGKEPAREFGPLHLIGRSRHLAALNKALQRARVRGLTAALVRGHSGMGKSFLVEHFLRDVGVKVVAGRCYERQVAPFNAFDSLIDQLVRLLGGVSEEVFDKVLHPDVSLLAELFPALNAVHAIAKLPRVEVPDPLVRRRRGFQGLRRILEALAPVVVHLDDVQWGDVDSSHLFGELAQLGAMPVLLVLSYRTEEESSSAFLEQATRDLARAGVPVRVVDVRELSRREALDFASALLPESPAEVVEAVARESGGSPFFVEELARHVRYRGGALGDRIDLDAAIAERVSEFPEEARSLVELVSVAVHPVDDAVLREASGQTDLVKVVDLLKSARLVSTRPGQVEAFHDRVRESVRHRIPSARAMEQHGRLARAIETVGDRDPEKLMLHWERAGEAAKAAPYARRAGDQSRDALAFDRAADRYGEALRLGSWADAEKQEILVCRARALVNAGRCAEGGRAYLEASEVDIGPPLARLDLRRLAMEHLLSTGHLDEGMEVAQPVLRAAGVSVRFWPLLNLASLLRQRLCLVIRGFEPSARRSATEGERFRFEVYRSLYRGLALTDFVQCDDFVTRTCWLALDTGMRPEAAACLTGVAASFWMGGSRDRARALRAVAVAERLAGPNPPTEVAAHFQMCAATRAFNSGRFRETATLAAEAAERFAAHCTGVDFEVTTCRLVHLWGLLFLGDFQAIESILPDELRRARDSGNLRFVATAQTEIFSMVALARDRPDRARAAIHEYTDRWARKGSFQFPQQSTMLAEAQVNAYAGDADLAHKRFEETWPALVRSLLLQVRFMRLEGWLLRARLALGAARKAADPTPLVRLAETCIARSRRDSDPWADAVRTMVQGTLADVVGRRPEALDHYRKAIAELDGVEMGLYAAAVRRRLGALDPDGSRGAANEAEAWFRAQGIVRPDKMTRMVLGS